MSEKVASLRSGFLRACERFPERPALEVAGVALSYAQLHARAAAIAATLARHTSALGSPLTAVFAHRSPVAYAGLLGALLRGHGYVPLNKNFPAERSRAMLQRAGCRALVADADSALQLAEVLSGSAAGMLVVLPDQDDVSEQRARWPQHRVLGKLDLEASAGWAPPAVGADALAYLLFTSGSTGVPKGVMVAHRNVRPFIDYMAQRYAITEQDRCSQTFELTFDPSVFDLFVTWERGACVCVPAQKVLIQPGRFIQEARLTLWYSVPSTGVFMKRLGALKPGVYPSLRASLFAGEALPAEVARAWQAAAPHSVIDNLYGPTEVTITCMHYRFDSTRAGEAGDAGVVPIGEANPGMTAMVVGPDLREVAEGEEGELLMAGPQVTPGYWNDPERTAQSFIVPPGQHRTFYRTGDRVRRPAAGQPMPYLGRLDRQLQIHGHRVELGEVEAALRAESGVDAVVAIGWPVTASGSAGGVEAFLGDTRVDAEAVRRRIATRLPEYMVPRRLHLLPALPLSAHGKYDHHALVRLLEES